MELRDEAKRIQLALKGAEEDLKLFRQQASSFLQPQPQPQPQQQENRPLNTQGLSQPPSSSSRRGSLLVESSRVDAIPVKTPIIRRSLSVKHSTPATNDQFLARSHIPPADDVINMGKRVVEELGTQFWGLFEDIKNVTMGEEPRLPVINSTDNSSSDNNTIMIT